MHEIHGEMVTTTTATRLIQCIKVEVVAIFVIIGCCAFLQINYY
jgi:hypothetical protein